MKKLAGVIGFLLTGLVSAQPVELTCVEIRDGHTVSIVFDENERTVRRDSGPVMSAYIDQSVIEFYMETSKNRFFQRINRSNGMMMIRSETSGNLLTPYRCTRAAKQF